MTGRRTFLVAVIALLAATAAATWILAIQDPRAGASPAARTAAKPAVVGEVTVISAGRLRAAPAGGGATRTLRKGSDLRLGDVVSIGPGTKATILLTRPAAVPTDAELVFLRASDGRPRDVTVRSKGTRQTVITIG